MPFVSLTRLRLRSNRFLPAFLFRTWSSVRQAQRSAGFVAGALGRDGSGGFWTVTVWERQDAMRAYIVAGAHRQAMPKLFHWCDEAAIAHWDQDEGALPDNGEVLQRMQTQGRVSKVRHPSPAHAANQTAPVDTPPQILQRFSTKAGR